MSQPEKPRSPIDPARNVLEVVTNLKAGLRNSDRKVAELVLENPGVVLGATLAKTARRAREGAAHRILRLRCVGYPRA